jgi:hypothetical protein
MQSKFKIYLLHYSLILSIKYEVKFRDFFVPQNHADNQAEFGKLIKSAEENIQGRTVCQDCGCEYVTK